MDILSILFIALSASDSHLQDAQSFETYTDKEHCAIVAQSLNDEFSRLDLESHAFCLDELQADSNSF